MSRLFSICGMILSLFLGNFALVSANEMENADMTEKSDMKKMNQGHASHMPNNEGVSVDTNPLVKKELELVRIDEKVGNTVNTDITFMNHLGEEVKLDDLIGEKPVVLSFVYYSCPLFCQYVLKGKETVLKDFGLRLGSDYEALTISFDHKDNQKLAMETFNTYTKDFGESAKNWNFLYGNEEDIKNITDQFGFYFKWVEANQEYAHSAAIYVISPEKKISRYLYGINYNPFDLKMAVLEAKQESYKSTTDRILLFCYRYSSEDRGYVLQAKNVMKAGGLVTMTFLFGFLFYMFRKERKAGKLV